MGSVNKVILLGNLGHDAEVRQVAGGGTVAKLRLATTETWNDKSSGERRERTEWHQIDVWGKQATTLEAYLLKGRQIYVEGSLHTRQWEDRQGNARYSTEIRADRIVLLRSEGGGDRPAGGGGDHDQRRPYDDAGAQAPPLDDDTSRSSPGTAAGSARRATVGGQARGPGPPGERETAMRTEQIDWNERVARRVLEDREPPPNTGLLPPERFSDEYAPEDPEVPGERGPASSAVEAVIAGACSGWGRKPDAKEFYEAMRAKRPTRRQQTVASVMIAEGTLDHILLAYLQGAFTWRRLVRMMHRGGLYNGELAHYVNMHAEQE